ncbi:MAG: nuclear transport factor 2 family protein [Verrucomicrobia bacterium]|nr:nuclear transport factor 2 family protein [Verrucomicrobiota bacterium]
MNNRELAAEFLRCFCAGDIDGLASLMTDDFQFTGPLFSFESKGAYLDCLRRDPPDKCEYRVISLTEGPDSVSIYYDYKTSTQTITIAQLFSFREHKISEVLLVFDGRGFA